MADIFQKEQITLTLSYRAARALEVIVARRYRSPDVIVAELLMYEARWGTDVDHFRKFRRRDSFQVAKGIRQKFIPINLEQVD